MTVPDAYKKCPRCQTPAMLHAPTCTQCGREYNTKFPAPAPPVEKTMVVPAPMLAQMIYCLRCRAAIAPTEALCPHCGWNQQTPQPVQAVYAPPPQVLPPPPPVYPPAQIYYQPQHPPVYGDQGTQPDAIRLPAGSHSPGLALFLSLLIIGIGQMYNRQIAKGIVLMLISIVLTPVTYGAAWVISSIVSSIDACMIAKKLQRGQAVGLWEFF